MSDERRATRDARARKFAKRLLLVCGALLVVVVALTATLGGGKSKAKAGPRPAFTPPVSVNEQVRELSIKSECKSMAQRGASQNYVATVLATFETMHHFGKRIDDRLAQACADGFTAGGGH